MKTAKITSALIKLDPRFRGDKLKELSVSLLFYLAILFFIIGFNFSDNRAGGWIQQFMPDLGGRTIQDITFLDSLIGYASARQTSDTSYILKTINGGDNWQIIYRNFFAMTQLEFLNANTGYAVGAYLYKTTNGGLNWNQINVPPISPEELYVLNEDSIWLVQSEGLTGGVYRTTDGGASWTQQFYMMNNNPTKIYMYNARIGFISRSNNLALNRTTNGGENWTQVTGTDGFTDIYFQDSLTGWKVSGFMRKTTNGGLNWVQQTMPSGGAIIGTAVRKLTSFGRDSLWGAYGGAILWNSNQARDILYRTTNGGQNWLFQIPDTSMPYSNLSSIKFVDKLNGWSYAFINIGLHTVSGGDTIFYTGIQQMPNSIPEKFILKQNYPNPFNPRTVIPYSVSSSAYVKIIAYDITGREVQRMVDSYHYAGAYEVDFMGMFASTGVYFYRMTVTDDKSGIVYTDTKKMILLK